ncbi:MAG: response regulator transcription factor [Nitrospirota bacterium]
MTIRIILVDDHTIVRTGLRSLLDKLPGLEVVAEAENGRKALELVRTIAPDIVIMDVSMPDMNGIEAARRIVAETPGVKILALSMHSDKYFVAEMLKAGASGYLLKDCIFEELAHAIHTVAAGHTYLSPGITGVMVRDYVYLSAKGPPSAFSTLTAREREVLQLLAEGKTARDIAALLKVSIKTVETYRQHLMDKLDLHSIAELTKYAIREGLTSLGS